MSHKKGYSTFARIAEVSDRVVTGSVQREESERRMLGVEVPRHRFGVEEYHRMAQAGILGEDDRVELVHGEIVEMTPIGSRHHACVMRLNQMLVGFSGEDYIVSVQGPLRVDENSEPQPDVALLRRRADFYAGRLPAPEDTLIVIEVSETTLSYDRNVKLPLYGRAGVPEVWIVDLAGEKIELYANPGAGKARSGFYTIVREHGLQAEVRSEVMPSLGLEVRQVLGTEPDTEPGTEPGEDL